MPYTTASGHILIVDDDSHITNLLQVNLRSEGYTVDCLKHAEDVDRGKLGTTSLIIVDSMDQSYSGMDLIYDLYDDPRTQHIGVILYSTIKSERMIIDALDAGVDDYVVKPFSLRELVARIKSVMRRHSIKNVQPSSIVTFQNLTVDMMLQSVLLDGRPVSLSKTEFSILALLLKNVNTYVSRADIHRTVWDGETAGVNERIVDTNISRLRKKLGELGNCIVNRSGHGYMIG